MDGIGDLRSVRKQAAIAVVRAQIGQASPDQTRSRTGSSHDPKLSISLFSPLSPSHTRNQRYLSRNHELAQADVCSCFFSSSSFLVVTQVANEGCEISLANVAGTQEPIYGPDAIQSVSRQAETTPYTELKKKDLKWRAPQYTSVETQTFYVMADNGGLAMLQVIYSNVA